ncbi:7-keto-8-aminopelargonate synthetase [Emydomyces testavorans]|uniref:7-keto-8-aminopelargonate synthetase n=1 Tax=Emydomyces testavorans TaxID=2070801 RepID=A0AAF0DHA9_9EURO|nr:7-keto-8-aminopelargonate synthetase [Emydomyces testavorans]
MKRQNPLLESFKAILEERRTKGRFRSLKVLPPDVADFSSNDFLSLSTSAAFRELYLDNLAKLSDSHRIASSGSRLLDGNCNYAEALEDFLAGFHNAPSGRLFNSGYDANVGIYSCVPQRGDVIMYDELIHASSRDGMRLSRASKRVPFRHNSVQDFRYQLQKEIGLDPLVRSGKRNVIVGVESLYSMEGDFAPIREILDELESMLPHGNGHLIVDEAHSTGIFGPRGAGIVQSLGVENRVFIRLHTFGKSIASNGAIALCSPLTRDYLTNYARPLIFSSALGIPTLVATRTTYDLMAEGGTEPLQTQLQQRIQLLRTSLADISPADSSILQINHHPTSPIFSLRTKFPHDLAKACQKEGLMVRAIMSPTVPLGTERVRVCLHARNSVEELQKLVSAIGEWVQARQQPRARL